MWWSEDNTLYHKEANKGAIWTTDWTVRYPKAGHLFVYATGLGAKFDGRELIMLKDGGISGGPDG